MRLFKLVITAVTLTKVWGLPQKLDEAPPEGEDSMSALIKRDPSSGLVDHPSSLHQAAEKRTAVRRRIERRTEPGPFEPTEAQGPHSPLPIDANTRRQLQEMTDIIIELIEGISLPIARCMSKKVWELKQQGGGEFDIHDLHRFRVECEEEFYRKISEAGLWNDEWELEGRNEGRRPNGSPTDGTPGDQGRNGGRNAPHPLILGGIDPKQVIKGTLNTIGGKVNAINERVNAVLRAHSPSGGQPIKPAGFPAGAIPARPLAW